MFLLFSLNSTDIPYEGDFYEFVDWVNVKLGLSKEGLILKTVATFVQM